MQLAAQCTLDLDILHLQAIRIEQFAEIAFFCRRVLARKETIVEAYLRIDTRIALYPVDSSLGLAVATFCS